jgi:hypothetical protein
VAHSWRLLFEWDCATCIKAAAQLVGKAEREIIRMLGLHCDFTGGFSE